MDCPSDFFTCLPSLMNTSLHKIITFIYWHHAQDILASICNRTHTECIKYRLNAWWKHCFYYPISVWLSKFLKFLMGCVWLGGLQVAWGFCGRWQGSTRGSSMLSATVLKKNAAQCRNFFESTFQQSFWFPKLGSIRETTDLICGPNSTCVVCVFGFFEQHRWMASNMQEFQFYH